MCHGYPAVQDSSTACATVSIQGGGVAASFFSHDPLFPLDPKQTCAPISAKSLRCQTISLQVASQPVSTTHTHLVCHSFCSCVSLGYLFLIFALFSMPLYFQWLCILKCLVAFPGYLESSVDMLGEALQTCLSVYNEGTSQQLNLVFFSEAVHHAARLSRVFVSICVKPIGQKESYVTITLSKL